MEGGEKQLTELAEECLDVINNGHFHISDPGPLHTPVRSFSLRRNDKLTLIVETELDPNATTTAVQYAPGTMRFSVERTTLVNPAGVEAELHGVIPYTSPNHPFRRLEDAPPAAR